MPKPFAATWDSLKTYQIPEWYQDAKFGIFIHWGLYAVPAFGNEWYPRNMYLQGTLEYEHHLKTYGPQDRFGYKDFIPQFLAERYDPAAWAALFEEAGARFVVPVAEHHDGFPMYDTALSNWSAAKMGPRRDLIGDLAAAVRQRGMIFGVSSHRAEHWWFMNGGRDFDSDLRDPACADFYGPAVATANSKINDQGDWKSRDWTPRPDAAYLEDWLARCCELVDKYQPQLFWFDWWIEQIVFQPYLQRFAAFYYNRGLDWDKGVAINYKYTTYPEEAAVLDIERGQLAGIRPLFWQTDTSVSRNSWGYIANQDYKPASDIIQDLVDIVSKNGALLLNIGPRADGTIPAPEQAILREIGAWLKVNGEAIYATRPWIVFGEGPTAVTEGAFTDTHRPAFTGSDLRFTQKTGGGAAALYITALAWPGETLTAHSLGLGKLDAAKIRAITLLGSPDELEWRQNVDGLHVEMPAAGRSSIPVLKIDLTSR
jgi:alpha-L-fucosidase